MTSLAQRYLDHMPGYVADFLTRFLRDWMPSVVREAEEAGREVVQTVVWIVGLSSGLLALLATKPEILNRLSGLAGAVLTATLAGAVALGVLQRIVYQLAEQGSRRHFKGLVTYLMGWTADFQSPLELAEYWDEQHIVRHLKEDFDLDYGFLLEYGVSLEKCQAIYRDVYERWQKTDRTQLVDLSKLLSAYLGVPEERVLGWLSPPPEASSGHTAIRQNARLYQRLHAMSYGLFVAASLSFLVALLVLAGAVSPL